VDKIKLIIEAVLKKEFRDVEIKEIQVREGYDFEDDEVLFITVVFSSSGHLNSKATSGFVRHVRPELNAVEETRFPVMSFVSHDDFTERTRETA